MVQEKARIFPRDTLNQWFLTFLKPGNTFDYVKNLRNTKINDPKTSRVEINTF